MNYEEWIEQYVSSQPGRFVRGKCHIAVTKMVEQFPELRKAAGFVHCDWGEEQHWWCVAPSGALVDPTAEQFRVIYEYEELDLEDPKTKDRVPIGRCANCGERTYRSSYGTYTCTKECAEVLAVELR